MQTLEVLPYLRYLQSKALVVIVIRIIAMQIGCVPTLLCVCVLVQLCRFNFLATPLFVCTNIGRSPKYAV